MTDNLATALDKAIALRSSGRIAVAGGVLSGGVILSAKPRKLEQQLEEML